jgi:septum formation protein
VLASGSPRRRELLEGIGLDFSVRPPDVEERSAPGETPESYVRRLSRDKAYATGEERELVLAADTVVVLDHEILEKPTDDQHARQMLARLAGREHRVLTGVTLRDAGAGDEASGVEESRVRMRELSREEIAWYVATGEPADKAGSYALQGIGGLFVEAVTGSSSNVIGLPLALVYDLFGRLGHDLRQRIDPGGHAAALDTLHAR